MNPIVRLLTRRPRVAALGGLALAAAATACADKAFAPVYTPSRVMQLQIQMTGLPTANQVGGANAVLVFVLYFHDVRRGDVCGRGTGDTTSGSNGGGGGDGPDTLTILNCTATGLPLVHRLAGSTASVTTSADLTPCLNDPTRRGSKDGCDIYVGAILADEAAFADPNANFSAIAYDFQGMGPFTVTPGHPPTIPSIDMTVSKYAVHSFVGDEALRVGGANTPLAFNGPITGLDNGGSVTLFGITFGSTNTQNSPSNYGPQLAVLQNGAWTRFQYPRGINTSSGGAGDAAALAVNDVYLIGQDGLYHFDGTSITAVSAVRGEAITAVGAASSGTGRTVVAGTANGAVWVGNGTTFQRYAIGGFVDMVCANGPSEAFATFPSGNISRFDGTTWTPVPLPGALGTRSDLVCLGSPGQAYVNSGQQATPLYKWNGTGWTAVPTTGLQTTRSWNFGVSSATEMWAVADSGNTNRVFSRFNGTSWSEVARTQARPATVKRPWASPRGGAFFAMSPGSSGVGTRIDRVTPAGVTVASWQPSLRDVIVPAPTSAFVVGDNMFLARWNGARWSVDAPPPGLNTLRTLHGVWSDGPTNAWVVGQQSTILRWNGTTWSSFSSSLLPILSPVDNYRTAWGTGSTVWIGGDASLVRCIASLCAAVSAPGSGALFSIWGLSANNVYAVGTGGRILHFDGTTWTQMTSGTGLSLFRVWGSGPNDVYAAGENVFLHFNGSNWASQPLLGGLSTLNSLNFGPNVPTAISFNLGMWGTGPNEAYVGGPDGRVARFNGFSWDEMFEQFNTNGRLTGISGVRGGCVLAVRDGFGGNIGYNLLRSVGPNGECGAPMTGPLSWP